VVAQGIDPEERCSVCDELRLVCAKRRLALADIIAKPPSSSLAYSYYLAFGSDARLVSRCS
jgi:hypothetical protein